MKQILAYILFFLGLSVNLLAQTAVDTVFLDEVKLVESRLSTHKIGTNFEIINPEIIGDGNSQTLSEFLTTNTALYIKQYGALSTPTFRGASSSHTLVLWNGIPINSIANGLADLSILPINSFSEVAIVHGGDGSVFGSGAIGGSIHYNSTINFKSQKQIKLTTEKSSFGLESNSISFLKANNQFAVSGFLLSTTDDNTFEFINTTQIGRPSQVNNYGKLTSDQQQLNLAYKLNKSDRITFNYWGSQNEREVPQNMTTPFSDAKQYDNSKRLLFASKHSISNISLCLKQAYIKENFRYTELLKNIDSKYLAESHISDVDVKLYKGNYLLNIGGEFSYKLVENNNYISVEKNEKQVALFSAFQYNSDFLQLNTILRKQWKTAFEIPYIPTLAFGANLNQNIKIRAKYNMSFRSPTFNDRFWTGPGANGNPNLDAENSWNKELGIDLSIKRLIVSATAYTLNISDMILWQAKDNGNWTPNNIKQVWSRGVETKLQLHINKINIEGNYAFTKSTNELATGNLDNTVGKQLRYVPLHKGNIIFILTEGDVQIRLNQTYTGEVITTYSTEQDRYLEAFILTDISVKTKIRPLTIEGKVKNLMNISYQTYLNYPNPGRELLLTLNYSIN